jgi:hypothetical protein
MGSSDARLARVLWRKELEDRLRARLAEVEPADQRTMTGRLVAGLQEALEVLGVARSDLGPELSAYGPQWVGEVLTDCDVVSLILDTQPYEDGTPELMPIRLVVQDGGDGTVAGAYLSVEQAERLVVVLTAAIAGAGDAGETP